jgi:hypothetical protein
MTDVTMTRGHLGTIHLLVLVLMLAVIPTSSGLAAYDCRESATRLLRRQQSKNPNAAFAQGFDA